MKESLRESLCVRVCVCERESAHLIAMSSTFVCVRESMSVCDPGYVREALQMRAKTLAQCSRSPSSPSPGRSGASQSVKPLNKIN